MIIQELAYKISIQAGDFLLGKRKVEAGSTDLVNTLGRNNKKTDTELQKLAKSFKNFGDAGKNSLDRVQMSAAKFLGVALTLEGARRMFLGTTEQLVRLGNSAGFLGMSTQNLDGFNRTAQAAGVSADSMGAALMRLKNSQLQVQTGLSAPDSSTIGLRMLEGSTGIGILDAKDPGQMLLREAQALRKLPRPQAQAISGQIGNDPALFQAMLRPDFEKNVNQYTGSSNATPAAVKQAQQVQKSLTDLKQAVDGVGISLLQVFGPDITNGLQALQKWITENKGEVIGFFRDVNSQAKALVDAVGGVGNALKIYAGWKVGGLPGAVAVAGGLGADATWDDVIQKKSDEWYGKDTTAGGNFKKNSPLGKASQDPVVQDIFHFLSRAYTIGNDTVNSAGYYIVNQVIPNAGAAEMQPNFPQSGRPEMQRGTSDKLLNALMMTESGGNPLAYNKSGATGAFQLMAGTARDLGLTVNSQQDDRLDPEKSRAAASIYMSQLIKRYKGNVTDALQAYNWGMGNMDKYIASGRTSFMPKETQDYPGKVASYYRNMTNAASDKHGSSSNIDNSQANNMHIQTVNVTTPATSIDQLTNSIQEQAARSRVVVSFSGGQ